jgi:hypothetical protein
MQLPAQSPAVPAAEITATPLPAQYAAGDLAEPPAIGTQQQAFALPDPPPISTGAQAEPPPLPPSQLALPPDPAPGIPTTAETSSLVYTPLPRLPQSADLSGPPDPPATIEPPLAPAESPACAPASYCYSIRIDGSRPRVLIDDGRQPVLCISGDLVQVAGGLATAGLPKLAISGHVRCEGAGIEAACELLTIQPETGEVHLTNARLHGRPEGVAAEVTAEKICIRLKSSHVPPAAKISR